MRALRAGVPYIPHLGRYLPALQLARAAWEIGRFLPRLLRPQSAEAWAPNGWQICFDCGGEPSHQFTGNSSGDCFVLACIGGQLAPSGLQVWGAARNPNHEMLYGYEYQHTDAQGDKYRHVAGFYRPTPAGEPNPDYIPARQPLLAPQAEPMPLPWRAAAANARLNGPLRDAGYGPSRRPALQPDFARHRPPGRGVRERKLRLMSGGPLRRLVERGFEAAEMVELVHGALPIECQAPRGATSVEQFGAIWNCYGRLDPCKLVENVVNNEIEDRMFGLLGEAAKREAQSIERAYGLSGLSRYLDPSGSAQLPKIDLGC